MSEAVVNNEERKERIRKNNRRTAAWLAGLALDAKLAAIR